ncbi:MAG TPA: extracellular solute-binding protein [Nocardioidaceae bacterium]|nr:extracellular solute-binding protein [Nocardioidaceae bacterium]
MRRPLRRFLGRSLAALVAFALCTPLSACGFLGIGGDADIQIYSARHYDLEKAFEKWEEETGKSVEFIFAEDAELLQRLKTEGADSPADIFMTVDAGNLWAAAEEGILAPVDSPVLDEAVPEAYRDSQNRWFGLALRARTVVYNPDTVDPSDFDATNTYAGLADPKWKGKLCMRGETESYTQSLIAALIDTYGRDDTLAWVKGWVANDVEVMSNDVLLLEAIDAGECEVGISNHYYLARILADDPDFNAKLYWASQDGDGVMENLSGGGVVTSSDNKTDAQELLEWLATDGQASFIGGNHEYPVNPDVEADEIAASFGPYKPLAIDAEAYGKLNAEATELLAEAGYK